MPRASCRLEDQEKLEFVRACGGIAETNKKGAKFKEEVERLKAKHNHPFTDSGVRYWWQFIKREGDELVFYSPGNPFQVGMLVLDARSGEWVKIKANTSSPGGKPIKKFSVDYFKKWYPEEAKPKATARIKAVVEGIPVLPPPVAKVARPPQLTTATPTVAPAPAPAPPATIVAPPGSKPEAEQPNAAAVDQLLELGIPSELAGKVALALLGPTAPEEKEPASVAKAAPKIARPPKEAPSLFRVDSETSIMAWGEVVAEASYAIPGRGMMGTHQVFPVGFKARCCTHIPNTKQKETYLCSIKRGKEGPIFCVSVEGRSEIYGEGSTATDAFMACLLKSSDARSVSRSAIKGVARFGLNVPKVFDQLRKPPGGAKVFARLDAATKAGATSLPVEIKLDGTDGEAQQGAETEVETQVESERGKRDRDE